MMIQLSYWDIEEAVIDYLKKTHNWEIESDQIQGAYAETEMTTYAYKDKDGDEVVDREKSTSKKEGLPFDGTSEMSFFIEPKESG